MPIGQSRLFLLNQNYIIWPPKASLSSNYKLVLKKRDIQPPHFLTRFLSIPPSSANKKQKSKKFASKQNSTSNKIIMHHHFFQVQIAKIEIFKSSAINNLIFAMYCWKFQSVSFQHPMLAVFDILSITSRAKHKNHELWVIFSISFFSFVSIFFFFFSYNIRLCRKIVCSRNKCARETKSKKKTASEAAVEITATTAKHIKIQYIFNILFIWNLKRACFSPMYFVEMN